MMTIAMMFWISVVGPQTCEDYYEALDYYCDDFYCEDDAGHAADCAFVPEYLYGWASPYDAELPGVVNCDAIGDQTWPEQSACAEVR